MRRFVFVLPLLAAACATPREACISQASGDLRTLNLLISETQSNIARGFTYEVQQEIVTVKSTCEMTDKDGKTFSYPCDEVQTIDHRVPIAIDLNVEKAKLSSMLAQQKILQREVETAIQQCIAVHPE